MDYVSEFTRFMTAWLAQQPAEFAVRTSGLALWQRRQPPADNPPRATSALTPKPSPHR